MATRSAWVLNLDAEYELEDPRGYAPSRAMRERVRALTSRLHGLLSSGDIVLDEDVKQQPGRYLGKAWCPTPRALAALAAAGCSVPDSPPLRVLQRVNDRRFAVELDSGPLGARYVTDADSAVASLRAASPTGRWLIKRAFGLSGRGHLRVDAIPSARDMRWLVNSFALGHGVTLEPWVQREADFALHGLLARDGQLSLGRAVMQRCDARGSWQETLAIPAGGLQQSELDALRHTASEVGRALLAAGYWGPFGIDAFRYLDPKGQRCFHPLVEINARYSMGWPLSGLPT